MYGSGALIGIISIIIKTARIIILKDPHPAVTVFFAAGVGTIMPTTRGLRLAITTSPAIRTTTTVSVFRGLLNLYAVHCYSFFFCYFSFFVKKKSKFHKTAGDNGKKSSE